MVSRAAPRQNNSVHARKRGFKLLLRPRKRLYGLCNRKRHFSYFFQHIVGAIPQTKVFANGKIWRNFAYYGLHIPVVNYHAFRGNLRKIPVVQHRYPVAFARKCRLVARAKILTVAVAYNQRAFIARRVYALYSPPHGENSVRAFEHIDRLFHRVSKVAVVKFIEKMGDNFAVGIRNEHRAVRYEFTFQLGVIFYYAVMYHGNIPYGMGMRIPVRRCAVRRPARMPYTRSRPQPVDKGQKLFHPALFFYHDQLVAVQKRAARRIIPAVFQPLQPLINFPRRISAANIPDYSAHIL